MAVVINKLAYLKKGEEPWKKRLKPYVNKKMYFEFILDVLCTGPLSFDELDKRLSEINAPYHSRANLKKQINMLIKRKIIEYRNGVYQLYQLYKGKNPPIRYDLIKV